MLDRDLAKLYGVETKYLKRQVRRNIAQFPDDFMFEMTPKEFLIKVNDLENRMGKQDGKIKLIFDYLKQFVKQQKSHKSIIGFKPHNLPKS